MNNYDMYVLTITASPEDEPEVCTVHLQPHEFWNEPVCESCWEEGTEPIVGAPWYRTVDASATNYVNYCQFHVEQWVRTKPAEGVNRTFVPGTVVGEPFTIGMKLAYGQGLMNKLAEGTNQ